MIPIVLYTKNVNEADTELYINGERLGMKWYGNHTYYMSPFIKKGNNTVEIKLTTILANYCISLKANPVTSVLTKRYKRPFSSGLVGVELGK